MQTKECGPKMHMYVLKVSRTNLYDDEPTQSSSFEGDKLMQENWRQQKKDLGRERKKDGPKMMDGSLGEVT